MLVEFCNGLFLVLEVSMSRIQQQQAQKLSLPADHVHSCCYCQGNDKHEITQRRLESIGEKIQRSLLAPLAFREMPKHGAYSGLSSATNSSFQGRTALGILAVERCWRSGDLTRPMLGRGRRTYHV